MLIIILSNMNEINQMIFWSVFIGIASAILFFLVIGLLIMTQLDSKITDYEKINYAIVLGAGLDGDQVSTRLRKRLDVAYIELNNLEIPIIVSGGQGSDELISEAEAMSKYLFDQGISSQRLVLEDKSTSTQENLLLSSKIIPKGKPQVVIITSDYHMFRSKMLAKRMGWQVQGASAHSLKKTLPKRVIREIFAVLKDFFVHNY